MLATVVLIAGEWGKVTSRDPVCTYIAGAVFEIVGIWVTAEALIDSFYGDRRIEWRIRTVGKARDLRLTAVARAGSNRRACFSG